MAELTTYDLETLRLGYYSALLQDRTPEGEICGYSIIGQATGWPKREQSVTKLVEMGFLTPNEEKAALLDVPLMLTPKGECLYGQFLEALETGKLDSFRNKK